MTTPARQRLMRDFKSLTDNPPAGITGVPADNNIMIWNAVIFGPQDTPFEGGMFKLKMVFTEKYPIEPPAIRFVSEIFHPNIHVNGWVGLDVLRNRWTPVYNVSSILISIQVLLTNPNPNSPYNSTAARLYKENKREYELQVKACVEKSLNDVKFEN